MVGSAWELVSKIGKYASNRAYIEDLKHYSSEGHDPAVDRTLSTAI